MAPNTRETRRQITIRLPDEAVAYLDELVAAGEVSSRADGVARVIRRERRRRAAEHDAQVYRSHPEIVSPELDAWDRARQFPDLDEG